MRSIKMFTILALGLMVWSAPIVHGAQYLNVNGQDVNSITLKMGQGCIVEVVSDDSTPYNAYVGFDNGLVLGVFFHLETVPLAGDLASATDYDVPAFRGYYISAAGSSPAPSAGIHFVFEYMTQQLGVTDLKLYDSTFTSVIDSVHITVIPTSMGTAFTCQGRLMDDNSPADGLYDLKFKLYDNPDPVFAVQLESTIDINDFDVIDGQFAVELDFGSEVFNGDARWLETAVRPGDSNDPNAFVTLSPRQELTPVPYALYAASTGSVPVPLDLTGSSSDSIIKGSNSGSGYAVSGRATATGFVQNYGGHFVSNGDLGIGVYGEANAPGNVLNVGGLFKAFGDGGYGVVGENAVSGNVGFLGRNDCAVYGVAVGDDQPGVKGRGDNGYGVVGWTNAGDKSGVYGWSNNGVGVRGRSDNSDGVVGWTDANDKSGVYGWSNNGAGVTARCNGNNHGIFGATFSSDPDHAGVFGRNNGNGPGVYGEATDAFARAMNYGGYFKSAGIDGIGVYGEATSTSYDGWPRGGYFKVVSPLGVGVRGEHTVSGNFGNIGNNDSGVHGLSNNSGYGVRGDSNSSYGVYGSSDSGYGVYGISSSSYAGYFNGDVYVNFNVSARSFTDRTPYPKDLATAYEAVMSMGRLPDGQYDENNKEAQLDHSKLSDFIGSEDGNRDLSATVSCHNEVLKDLIRKRQELDKAHIYIEQLNSRNKELEARLIKLEAIVTQMNVSQRGAKK